MYQLRIILLARDQIARSMERTFRYEESPRRRALRWRGRRELATLRGRQASGAVRNGFWLSRAA